MKRIQKVSLSPLYVYIYINIIYLWQGPFCIIRVVHLPSNSEKWRFTSYLLPFIWDGKGKYCLNHQPIWSAPFDWSTELAKFSEFKLYSIKFHLRKWTFLPLEFENIHTFQGPVILSPTCPQLLSGASKSILFSERTWMFYGGVLDVEIPVVWSVLGDHFNLLGRLDQVMQGEKPPDDFKQFTSFYFDV